MSAAIAARQAIWWASCIPELMRFRRSLERTQAAQSRLLREYVRSNADTVFGRRHGFGRIRSIDEFRAAVPLASFDDLRPYVDRAATGEPGVLTRDPVRLLEPSSGSASAVKLIPYTATLGRELARGLAPWIASLFNAHPALCGGPAYWSITPREVDRTLHATTVPVGFDEDTAYLGGALQRLLAATMAVPPEVRLISDVTSFRYVTALMLVRARGLRLISVWHPSYLMLLFDSLRQHWDALVEDVRSGLVRPPGVVDAAVIGRLERGLRPAPRRAAEIERCGPCPAGALWPQLRVVSCWADGHARSAAGQLVQELPGVRIQPKGLLATEAFVTIPWERGHVLAVRSHFFEFLTAGGDALLAHELAPGDSYSVVVTTGGGLYRYRLDDRVQVTGFAGTTPLLRFVGKEGHVSDQRGEKLHAAFVAEALRRALAGRRTRFAMLAPDTTGVTPGYTLYVEPVDGVTLDGVVDALDHELRENPHYRACVDLGQLRASRVYRISGSGFDAFAERSTKEGRRLGDLKPQPLSVRTGWSAWFDGTYDDVSETTLEGARR